MNGYIFKDIFMQIQGNNRHSSFLTILTLAIYSSAGGITLGILTALPIHAHESD